MKGSGGRCPQWDPGAEPRKLECFWKYTVKNGWTSSEESY